MLFDADDRLVICNSATGDFFPHAKDLLVPATRFEELPRADIEGGHLWKTDRSVDEFIEIASELGAGTMVTLRFPPERSLGTWSAAAEKPADRPNSSTPEARFERAVVVAQVFVPLFRPRRRGCGRSP
ncbi:MAG TPA: hypothetical protein VGG57_00880 [Stellaceae bacterium]|jgi:hypothetical protein